MPLPDQQQTSMHTAPSHHQDLHPPGTLTHCVLPPVQVNPTAGPLVSTPADAIDKILDINIKAALLLVQEAVPHMKRGGRIVLISSVTAFQ